MTKYFLNNKINLLLYIIYMIFLRLLFSGLITDCLYFDDYFYDPRIRLISLIYFMEDFDRKNNLFPIVYGPEKKKSWFDFLNIFEIISNFPKLYSYPYSLSINQERQVDYMVNYLMPTFLPSNIKEHNFYLLSIIQYHALSLADADKNIVKNCYNLLVFLNVLYITYIPGDTIPSEAYFTFAQAKHIINTTEIHKLTNLLMIVMEREVEKNNNYYLSFKQINLYKLYYFPEKYDV